MRVTLVRHCEVDEKYKGCYNGHNDIGLSKEGERQAKELANRLDMSDFDAVFCSDLRRTKESLRHSLHVKDVIYTDKLREKSWGRHEGMRYDEITSKENIEYKDFMQWLQALDGEHYRDLIKRVEEFFLEFLPSLKKESVLVMTHAGVIRVLMSILEDISLEEAFGIEISHASATILDIKSFTKEDNEHI